MHLLDLEKSLLVGCAKQPFRPRSCSAYFHRVLLVSLACVLLTPFVAAQNKNPSKTPEPLAAFGGQPIDESQLPPGEQSQLQRMMQQVYGVKLRALHEVLDQKLVEAEAKRQGVSVDDLFKSEVLAKATDPTEDQVNAYHQAHPGQANQPFDPVKVRQEMKTLEVQRLRSIFIHSLWQQAINNGELVLLMTMPRVEFPIDPVRLRGDAKAPVTVVEFSDFSCPYCRKAEATVEGLLAKYPGKVKLEYRDFPLIELHPQAHLAAEASRCAAEQGKYWEYHDLLFASPEKQTQEALLADARTLKLDDKQFDACLSSARFKPQVDQDILLGTRAGVISTPAFFVNGTFISGAQPADIFEKAVEESLAQSRQEHSAN